MLEVAVIGAGTSGLVAARHLILAGMRPTIFEAARIVGGAWTPPSALAAPSTSASPPPSPPPSFAAGRDAAHPAGKMWNGMSTNLSKYACRFSDWPWPENASTFPSAEEMHAYLESYADAFLTASPFCTFQMECKVLNVKQSSKLCSEAGKDAKSGYKVEWTDLNTQTTHSRDFGGVVVATGFFHTPRWPAFLKNHMGNEKNKKPQLMHSSEYRTHHTFRGKNVAVIGSSFSALEIAVDVARSAARVVNVSPSVPWVLPRWIPTIQALQSNGENVDCAAVSILPVDLALYQRAQPYPKIPETISLTPEDCQKRHQYLRSLVGHKQRLSPLGEPINWEEPPHVVISDEFLDLVREGKVELVHGRLAGIDEDGTLQITHETETLRQIDHIICCTGYTPRLQDLLSPDMLSILEYDPEDGFCPMTLAWDTLHPSLPGLAFCGFYKGPYLGIMELQARLAAGVMSGSISLEEEQVQSAMKDSQTIRNTSPRAQFPHFDYPGFMDTLSQLCYRGGDYPKHNLDPGDMVVPTFYQPDDELSTKCKSEIQEELRRGQDGSRMAKLVLQSLLGKWSFDRKIVHLQTRKVERVSGTVKYSKHWERCSADNDDANADKMLSEEVRDNLVLYREDGLYEFSPTQKFEVFREYEYECKADSLEIFFVEGGERAHLFLSLKFLPEAVQTQSSNDDGYWVKATSDHLCIKDLYSATFRVKLNGLCASEIIIKYRVRGPAKDYESTTFLKPKWS